MPCLHLRARPRRRRRRPRRIVVIRRRASCSSRGGRSRRAAADAAMEPAPERARVDGRRAEARAGAPRQVELLRGGRPRRGDARGRRLVRGGGGAAVVVVVVPRRRRAGVEQGLLLIRQRDLLDRRRPVRLQMIPHGRPNTRAPAILINRFLLGGKKIRASQELAQIKMQSTLYIKQSNKKRHIT